MPFEHNESLYSCWHVLLELIQCLPVREMDLSYSCVGLSQVHSQTYYNWATVYPSTISQCPITNCYCGENTSFSLLHFYVNLEVKIIYHGFCALLYHHVLQEHGAVFSKELTHTAGLRTIQAETKHDIWQISESYSFKYPMCTPGAHQPQSTKHNNFI